MNGNESTNQNDGEDFQIYNIIIFKQNVRGDDRTAFSTHGYATGLCSMWNNMVHMMCDNMMLHDPL